MLNLIDAFNISKIKFTLEVENESHTCTFSCKVHERSLIMKNSQNPEMLSPSSRRLTYAVASIYTILGLPLFLGPEWAAQNFLWNVTPFLAMTIGAWYLGAAFVAWQCARTWRWSLIYMGMIFVWTFSLLETLLLVIFWSTLRLDGWIAWIYVFVLAVGSIVAILGVLDWIRSRPSVAGSGSYVPVWQRFFLFVFIAFALYISVPLLIGTAKGGNIWPGQLTPLSARGFGAFYFAIAFGDLFGLFERRLSTFHFLLPFATVGSSLLLLPALVYLNQFNFQAQPGGLIYIITYVSAIIISAIALFTNRSSRRSQMPESVIGR
jgi:hypothetical protein